VPSYRVAASGSGIPVGFTNSDLANHNVRGTSFVAENNFSVFVPYEQAYRHRFRADKKQRPVVLSCDIHPWVKAWIYVFDHSFFAVSDAEGKLRIDGISPGTHELQLRQPDVAYRAVRNVPVTAGETTRIELRISDRDLRP